MLVSLPVAVDGALGGPARVTGRLLSFARASRWLAACPPARAREAGMPVLLQPGSRAVPARAAAQSTAAPPAGEAERAASRAAAGRAQTVDYTTLAACALELRRLWCPARVEQVLQVDRQTVALRLRTLEHDAWLYLSWHPQLGHVGVGGPPKRGAAAEAFSFGEQLHGALRGMVLADVRLPAAWERVMELRLAARAADEPTNILYCELMGHYSNVVLTTGAGKVLAAGYQVGSRMSSARQVQAGAAYRLPPPVSGQQPEAHLDFGDWRGILLETAHAFGRDHDAAALSIREAGVRAYSGVSPALMRELCAASSVDHKSAATSLADAQWTALHQRWSAWVQRVQSGGFVTTSEPSGGGYSVLGSYPQPVSSLLEFLHEYYGQQQASEAYKQAKHNLQRGLSSAITRLEKKVSSLQQQGGKSDLHLATKHQGDLLMANLYRCQPGMASISVEDWDSRKQVDIPLDPHKPAAEVASAIYKQARKQRRAVEQVAPLIEEAEQQLAYLAEVEVMLAQLDRASGMDALMEVQAELIKGGYIKAPPEVALASKAQTKAKKARKRAGGDAAGSAAYRKYTSPGGYDVLIGRNSSQNDQLSLHVAQPTDVWMHARGVPGAHVLLRVPPGRQPDDADIQFAADLAAWFSKRRADTRADVTCAQPKDISKPKGAKPGQVLVRAEKVVVGRPQNSVAAGEEQDDED